MVPISVEATVYVRALERKGRMAALGIQKIIIGDRSITFIHNDGRGGDEDDDDDIDVDNVDSEASEEEEEDYVDVNNEKVSKKVMLESLCAGNKLCTTLYMYFLTCWNLSSSN